jgi:hypothetical protein
MLLDYYTNFDPDPRITEAVELAGRQAGISGKEKTASAVLDGDELDAAAGGVARNDGSGFKKFDTGENGPGKH